MIIVLYVIVLYVLEMGTDWESLIYPPFMTFEINEFSNLILRGNLHHCFV